MVAEISISVLKNDAPSRQILFFKTKKRLMYFDLNVPVHSQTFSKKGKQPQKSYEAFNVPQITAIEARVDILAHCESKVILLTIY